MIAIAFIIIAADAAAAAATVAVIGVSHTISDAIGADSSV